MLTIAQALEQTANWRIAEPDHIECEINGVTCRWRANDWNIWATMPESEWCLKARAEMVRSYAFLLPLEGQ